MPNLIIAIAAAFVVFLTPSSVLAAAPTLSNVPSTIEINQSFQVNVDLTIGGSAGEKKYLRAAFATPGTTSYFGYTKNHFDQWYNGSASNYTQYKELTMNEFNSWSGVLEVKPDLESSNYHGPGTYEFKVRYYTAGGSAGDWSNTYQIVLTGSATPSPTPTPTPTPAASPSPTPSASATPTPTTKSTSSSANNSSSSSTPTPKPASPTPKPTLKPTSSVIEPEDPMVLGIMEASSSSESAFLESSNSQLSISESEESSKSGLPLRTYFAAGSAFAGLGLIGGSVLLFFKGRRSVKIDGPDEAS